MLSHSCFVAWEKLKLKTVFLLNKPKHTVTSVFRFPILFIHLHPSLSPPLLPSLSSSISVRQEGMWHTGLKLDLLTACFYLLNRTDCLPTMRDTLSAPLHYILQRARITSWKCPYCFMVFCCVWIFFFITSSLCLLCRYSAFQEGDA